jgi:hypothetical protein
MRLELLCLGIHALPMVSHFDTPWMGAFIAHLHACGWSACVSETMLCLWFHKHLGYPLEPHIWPPSLPPIALQFAPSLHPSCPQLAPSLALACPLPPSPNVPDANLAQCVAQGMTELACRIFCSGVPTFSCPIFSCPNCVFPVV